MLLDSGMTVAEPIVSAVPLQRNPAGAPAVALDRPAARGRRGVVGLAHHGRGHRRVDVRARRGGDGGRRAARRVPAAERARPPARARLPGRVVRAVGLGLRANLRANWLLLRRTGTSTNVLSKAAFELTGRRGERTQRVAAGAGYVATELAKEAPYYAGAFGAAVLTDAVSSNEALLFLAGANLGAAAYEYVLARADAQACSAAGVRVVRHRLGAAGVPDRLLQRRRAGRARDDRVLRRRDEGGSGRRAGAGLRHRAHAASRLPRRAEGLGAPPRRLPAREPRGDRALARARPRRPRLARVRPLHARMRGTRRRRPTRTSRGARSSPARRSRGCSRSTRAAPRPLDRRYATVISAYCADSATDDRAMWETLMANITDLVGPAACSSRPPCAAAAPTWSATSDSRARTSTSTTCGGSWRAGFSPRVQVRELQGHERRATRASCSRTPGAASRDLRRARAAVAQAASASPMRRRRRRV